MNKKKLRRSRMFEEGLYFMENHFELISIWRRNVFDEEKKGERGMKNS
jgi:hypothetical protein